MLVSLGRSFNVSVVAEGVETAGQAARLRALGCPRAQGYYFAKPGREVTFDTATRRRANVYAVRSATGA
jgi:EAL domain-containing protein (putative c-di-GMP-specific phosphodiesterase class I)